MTALKLFLRTCITFGGIVGGVLAPTLPGGFCAAAKANGNWAARLAIVFSNPADRENRTDSSLKAASVVDLRKVGWTPPEYESNRAFFKVVGSGRLESIDNNTRIAFLSEDVVVAYHTKQEGKDWHTAPRVVEAFFVRTKDGSLVSVKTWPTSLRRSLSDRRDSEGRILPLYGGRFLVFANGTMSLYGDGLELLKQQKLASPTEADLWAGQSVSKGREIFLRRESTSAREVTYSWLSADNLEAKYEMPGYRSSDFSVLGLVCADQNAVFTLSPSGLRMIERSEQVRTICDEQFCRGDGVVNILSLRQVGLSTKDGFGIVDADRGLIWSRLLHGSGNRGTFDFGEMRSASSGIRFAVWVTAIKKGVFDGIEVKGSPILLVYDRPDPTSRPLTISINPVDGQWDYAFSPGGAKLALFDGAKLRIYSF
jgi:hypothetical protein